MVRALIRTFGLFLAVVGVVLLAADIAWFARTGGLAPPGLWLRAGTGFVFWLLGFYYMRA